MAKDIEGRMNGKAAGKEEETENAQTSQVADIKSEKVEGRKKRHAPGNDASLPSS